MNQADGSATLVRVAVPYVDLGRTFQPFGGLDGPSLAARILTPSRAVFSWEDVLRHERVMVLATASSGKTEEFRAQASRLSSLGRAAFFIPIREFADATIEVLLHPAEERFAQWRAGEDPAWFFLDSIDEARLVRQTVALAWKKLGLALGQAGLRRARILVSGRPDEGWQRDRDDFARILPSTHAVLASSASAAMPPPPDPDQALLEPLFESSRATEPERREDGGAGEERVRDQCPLVLELVPLGTEQQTRLAVAAAVTEPGAFLKEMQRLGQDLHAETPGELLDLAAYWNEHRGGLGTREQVVEYRVSRRLAEASLNRPDNNVLSLEEARERAERVAAALTLTKSGTLRVAVSSSDVPSVDAGSVLPECTEAQRGALLRRAAFVLETYSSYRFHHRSTHEYLCASWLRRLAAASSRGGIDALLTSDTYGVQTLVPSLRAAAAWLALWDEGVRDEIIAREPLVLLREGDPQSLPLDAKSRLLLSFARKHIEGEIASDVLDYRRLRLFAEPGLAGSVREAWALNSLTTFRIALLCIVRDASIADCADLASDTAKDSKLPDELRVVALEAVAACEDQEAMRQLAATLRVDPAAASPYYASRAARVLFPQHLAVDALLTLIEASLGRDNDRSGFGSVLPDLWNACGHREREALALGLVALLRRTDLPRHGPLAFPHGVMGSRLGEIVRAELDSVASSDAPEWLVALVSLGARAGSLSGQDLATFRALVCRYPDLKRKVFWYDVRELIETPTTTPSFWSLDHEHAAWRLDESDLTWLLPDVASGSEDTRRVALQAAIYLLRTMGHFEAHIDTLRDHVRGSLELGRELDKFLLPPQAPPHELAGRSDDLQRKVAAREARDKAEWQAFARQLRNDPAILVRDVQSATPQIARLIHLTEWLSQVTGEMVWEAARAWQRLIPAFGPEVASSYVNAMMSLWRRIAPARPSREPGQPVSRNWEQELAFAGLTIEAAGDADWARALNGAEAVRAANHACMAEWNMPEWIDQLVEAHARRVLPALLRCLRFEWNAQPPRSTPLLRHIAQGAGREPRAEVLSRLIRLAAGRRPAQLDTLELVIRFLHRWKLVAHDERRIADSAVLSFRWHGEADEVAWACRYAALVLLVDPERGSALLLSWFAGTTNEERTRVGLNVLATLFNRQDALVALSELNLSVTMAESLVRVAYECVRPEDDIDHEGVYTPGVRDRAQEARDHLLSYLLTQRGSDAYEAVRRLSEHPSFRGRERRFRELAHGMAERDAEIPAWQVDEVLRFERDGLMPAKTGAQLLRIVLGVLEGIGRSFQSEDASSRALLASASDEKSVQEWLLEQLKLRAGRRFHAWREPEVLDGRKPDIVVASTAASRCEVAIEVKRADDWSLAELQAALQDQLVGHYLLPIARRHGVLFLTCASATHTWLHRASGERLNFASVVQHLKDIAGGIQSNASGPVKAIVFGLNASRNRRR